MIKYILTGILLFSLTSCGLIPKTYKPCNCCENTYTDLGTAELCISRNTISGTTSDNRLFLFAFVKKNLKQSQNLGWTCIKDQDIRNTAKQNYLLITIDPDKFIASNGRKYPDLASRIREHKEDVFYIITNQEALHPFGEWSDGDDKNLILEKLSVGNGP